MAKMKGKSLQQAMPASPKSETDYQAEDDMRTMHQASQIVSDSTRLKKVHKMAGRKHKALMGMLEPMMKESKPRSIQDLKDIAARKSKEEVGEE